MSGKKFPWENGQLKLGFWIFLLLAISATTLLFLAAGERAGAYWTGLNDPSYEAAESASSGFIVVDVSGTPMVPLAKGEKGHPVSLGMGPIPDTPSLLSGDVVFQEEKLASEKSPAVKQKKEETPVVWKKVIVGAGDTLSSLASRYNVEPRDIVRANELKDPDRLKQGQELLIPNTPEDVLTTLAEVRRIKNEIIEEKKQATPVKITFYTVKEGDTLWSIADDFDLDVNTLLGVNHLDDSTILRPGKVIRIPDQDGIFVKVHTGDTIAEIAEKYGVYKEAILSANSLTWNDHLKPGSEIFVPGAKPVMEEQPREEKRPSRERQVNPFVRSVHSFRPTRGFGWPVAGSISSPFGWRMNPFGGRGDFHTGLDISAHYGTRIAAAASGRVVYTGWMSGYGKVVVIEHGNGYTTLYAHCSRLLCSPGQTVNRGDVIAAVGATGRATGAHLHFEVRINGNPVNPLGVLR